jgi:UDP-GlcNAc:undecaprenyl-phosphate GlcNAc-1-phosphate transferase
MASINPFLLLTLAVAVSMLVIPLLSQLAPRLGLLDLPDARKVHAAPVPRVGGWGIAIGALAPLLLSFNLDPTLQAYVVGVAILFAFGVWDDAKELGHWTKFAGQVLAVAVVVFYGDLYVTRLPFFDADVLGPVAGKLFTVFAMIGAINAINHSDGLDGLAGGEALLTLIALAMLGHVVGSPLAVGIALAMTGGILGFLRYNSHPARVFMGDSGSQVLGFTLGFLVIYLTQVAHTALSAALPLLLLGLPIADILAVLYLRIRGGHNWFKATRNHIHHRLLALGFDHYETVIIIYSVHATLVICGVLLRYEADWTVTAVYLGVICALFAGLTVAERRGWRLRAGATAPSRVEKLLRYLTQNPLLRRAPFGIISAVVPGFMLFGSLWTATVPRDFAVAAGVLAAVVVVDMLRARATRSVIGRAATYAAAIFSMYLLILYPRVTDSPMQVATVAVIAILAVAIAAYVRFATQQEFGTTPTDYLVVFGMLALIVFGVVDTTSRTIVEFVAYSTVLLYGCEIVLGRGGVKRWPVLHVSTLATLAILAFKGVF